jgi:hypothetical protein
MSQRMGTRGTPGTRRRFLELLVAVVALHVVAITLYYALDVAHQSAVVQRRFAWTWMALSVAVVLIGLQRLKRARRAKPPVTPRP